MNHSTSTLLFRLSLALVGREPTQLPPRDLQAEEITITSIGKSGTLTTCPLKNQNFQTYKNVPVQRYRPELEGGFATVRSISDPSWSFAVHFKASETPTIVQQPLHERAIILTLHGLGDRASSLGVFATALRSLADIMLLGTVLDKHPDLQNKPPMDNFRQGSLIDYIADARTVQWGGGLQRMVDEPIDDIIKLLEDGVTITHPDGTTQHVRPYDYGTIIVVGFCIANATFIKIQEKLLTAGKRGFDGFIMDSPLADFQSPVPAKWARKPAGFGPPCLILPILQKLYNMGKAAPTYILRGGQDELCTVASALAVLRLSDPQKSMLVTTLPAGHVRCMFNDTHDRNVPHKQPWQHIDGSRQAHNGLMQEWFKKNFVLDRPPATS